MKYGIRNACLGGSWEQAFRQAAELGFDGVELDVGADYWKTPLWTPEGRQQVAQWAGQGAELCSMCIGALWTHSFGARDKEVRGRAREATQNTLQACAELGARWILIPVTPGQGASEEEGRGHWIEELVHCARMAQEHRVVLALENVGRGYAQSARALLDMAQAIGSPWVRTYYDFGNGLSLGNDPLEELELLGKEWIAVLHAKDPGGQRLGEGRLDWEGVVAKVQHIGYDGYVVLETPSTDDPLAAGRHNLAFLKERFG
jgi:sugar phosphate isomerase/epimerase